LINGQDIQKMRLALSLHREAKGLRFAKGCVVCMAYSELKNRRE